MIALSQFSGRHVAVFGLGRSGRVTAHALAAGGARVAAWDDDRHSRTLARDEGIPLAEPADIDWQGAAALVLSPGVPLTHPAPHPVVDLARRANCPIVGDIELLARARPDPAYVGITGTNGKSTTTALIGHIVAAAGRNVETGGNLGAPALGLGDLGADGVYVLELSSYQLDLLDEAVFDIAVLINISPDHLGRHGGMDGYVTAKRRIFRNQGPAMTAVVGVDDDRARAIHADLVAAGDRRVIAISAERPVAGGVYVTDGALIDDLDGLHVQVLDLSGVPTLPGVHNWQNAAAAYAAARAAGIDVEAVVRGIASYPGLAHRQERVATIDGVLFVNDSKATNADAAVRALACYDDIFWIAGGLAKEGGLAGVESELRRVREAFLIGEAEAPFAEFLAGRVKVRRCGTLAVATAEAHAAAVEAGREGAVVLLSPACASFDQFANFEQRGEAFRGFVQALAKAGEGGR